MTWLVMVLACGGPMAVDPPPEPTPTVAVPPASRVPATLFKAAPKVPSPIPHLGGRPRGFVDLRVVVPHVRLDVRYHTGDNFTGAPLPGYGAPGAWLHARAAEALTAVAVDLFGEGYGLHVYDAYRPFRATLAMVAWAERTGQRRLVEDGYIAARSNHNRGTTLDLTLYELETGEVVDMGVPWDTLDERSHTDNARGEVLVSRHRLRDAMARHGFTPYSKEWWHFRYRLSEEPMHLDVPYGCFEVPEGRWTAPEGWEEPGWTAPDAWPLSPGCDTVLPQGAGSR